MTTTETVKFDPGWGCHVLVYSGSVEYLYKDIKSLKLIRKIYKLRFRKRYN